MGYLVEQPSGQKGFLKALDYAAAFALPNTAVILNSMTQAYIFEKTLCEKCAQLSRVARAIDSGSIQIDPNNYATKVEYLIFERAERDIRAHLDFQASLDLVFLMKALHHVSVGLKQLHTANIAHQDLKPSNVLVFKGDEGSKICDLGRAWDQGFASPHDSSDLPGDPDYAPIEYLYDYVPPDENARRFGCDFYHLGSLIVFLFARVRANALTISFLNSLHEPGNWGGSYHDVLAYVQHAFAAALSYFETFVPESVRGEIRQTAAELCEPDPARRGHQKNLFGHQFSLERYISRFDKLSHEAMLALVKRKLLDAVVK